MFFGRHVPHLCELCFLNPPACVQEVKQVKTLLDYLRMQATAKEDVEDIVALNPFDQLVFVQPLITTRIGACSLLHRALDLQDFHDQQRTTNQLFLQHG